MFFILKVSKDRWKFTLPKNCKSLFIYLPFFLFNNLIYSQKYVKEE